MYGFIGEYGRIALIKLIKYSPGIGENTRNTDIRENTYGNNIKL